MGAPIIGFCNLHCDCRIQEWLLSLGIKSDTKSEAKAKAEITSAVKGVAREAWGFITDPKSKRVKSKILFGGEAKKLAELGGEKIFGKRNKKAVETYDAYLKAREFMFLNSADSRSRDKQKMATDLCNFKKVLLKNYGRGAITFYIHMLVDHLEEIICRCETFGYCLLQLSQEGVEQANSIFKTIYKRKSSSANNKSPLMQVMELEYRKRSFNWERKEAQRGI